MPVDPFYCLKACLGICFSSQPEEAEGPVRRADHYNARVRANIGLPPAPAVTDHYQPHPAIGLGITITTPPGQPQVKKVRFQTTDTTKWSTTNMDRAELEELFNLIHQTLEHMPYAICGLGAIIDHGFPGRKAKSISILCPRECRHNVQAWMATRGYEMASDSVGFPMRDGAIRRVRIKYLQQGFEKLERARSSFSNATVLSVASQLDQVAAGHLDNRRRGDERALKIVASDVFFLLDLLAGRRGREGVVDPRLLPTFLAEDFFADFTARHVDARPEMARAGIDVAAVLARHNAASALREHDEMLGQYGMRGDTVRRETGQFEGIRDLKDRKSVYTLREREREPGSRVETTAGPRRPARVDGDSSPDGGARRPRAETGAGAFGRNLTVPSSGREKSRSAGKPGPGWI
ncbi:hypothetical protein F5B18DRAFT_670692 [Nemania serpens]|nr:hypothetical protein F5B18DRAFT_670692 [Nemania serpens]